MQTTSNQRKNMVKTERFGFVLCVKCFKEVKCFSGEVQTQEKNLIYYFFLSKVQKNSCYSLLVPNTGACTDTSVF